PLPPPPPPPPPPPKTPPPLPPPPKTVPVPLRGAPPMSAAAAAMLLSSGGGGGKALPAPPQWDPDTIPVCPSEAAAWFANCYREVTATNLGGVFNGLLGVYIEVERGYKWEKGQGSSLGGTANRPKPLTQWVTAGRGLRGGGMAKGAGPSIGSIAVFDDVWWRWWGRLQGSWRKAEGSKPGRFERGAYPESAESWEGMRHPGQNGLLSVVATLYWWGKMVQTEGGKEDRESWTEAVADVKWVLKGLV
ncbi:hypothetical protein C8R46DRAFT_864987, partial [Mycena filopes]